VRLKDTKKGKMITAHLDARQSPDSGLAVGKEVLTHWDLESSKTSQG
jgi:hypothetical protein